MDSFPSPAPIRMIVSLLALGGHRRDRSIVMWPQSLGGSVAYIKVQGHSMDGTYKSGDLIVVRKHTTTPSATSSPTASRRASSARERR